MIEPFVSPDWLKAHRDEVVLADVRWYIDGRPGRPEYEAGHIPGAVFVDLDAILSGPHADDSQGRHPLPTPERFAGGLAELGIGDGDTVVAYDDAGGMIAARLVWLLRAIGHEAALLDGGLGAWPEQDLHPGSPRPRPAASFTPVPWPEDRLVEIDEVAGATDVLIDARDSTRFAGGPDPVDPRSGHIPGARSVPTREHLDEDRRIASAEQLRTRFAQAGIEPGTPVISYCGSGVTACHNLLALEHAGLGPGRLFPGSWSQWSRDPGRPVATGTDDS
ncbi:MAG TPA: sulfurtransferase [Solirubrobacteraceae bacterium]|nr:sulfurtransferase [Solirubrobacteraceae bacterium]